MKEGKILNLGIDDAGRGPVIGPMVLAGCVLDEPVEKELKKFGVKDSKQLTQKRREFLEKIIKEKAEVFEVLVFHPDEIDSREKEDMNLNDLEAVACAKIINKINKGDKKLKVIIDCPSVSINKWSDFLKTKIKDLSNLEIHCEHKADQNHVSVSAASVLAKCTREREMEKLKQKYGTEIGSGYCSDPSTCRFLEKNADKFKDEGIFRKTWVTWQTASRNLGQKKLF
ncbi:MAG: ribonuclease HII [archaeon]